MDSNGEESTIRFEERKRDHIDLALRPSNEAIGFAGFDRVELVHEALPDINFNEVSLKCTVLGEARSSPFFVCSMTAGHKDASKINSTIAQACEESGWIFGVGSQRRELSDFSVRDEWREIRKVSPNVDILGNLGLAQLILTPADKVQNLVDSLQAKAMIVHLNSLQECLQPEGTPFFKGGLQRISQLVKELSVPVIVKETGCGVSPRTLSRLFEAGVSAVDISGFGGTHWGRIEGQRQPNSSIEADVAQTFANWGLSTVDCLLSSQQLHSKGEVWASGGVRTGLDAAKAIALGAQAVGLAKPILQSALQGRESVLKKMKTIELELKIALFCTGSLYPAELMGEDKKYKVLGAMSGAKSE